MIEKYGLTNREYEICLLINKGLSDKGLLKRLVIGETTLKTHCEHIRDKLGLCTKGDEHWRVMLSLIVESHKKKL